MKKNIKRGIVYYYFAIILLSIFITHFLISLSHTHIFTENNYLEISFDSFIMASVLFPVLYFSFLRPLTFEIEERKKTQRELEKALEKAEESDRLKSEFLSHMSHEIRTPINVILNNLILLKEDIIPSPDPNISEYLEVIEEETKRLINTIESIINMAELNSGSYDHEITNVDLINEVLDPIINEYEPIIIKKELTLIKHYQEGNYFSNTDKYSLTQIVHHLIDNAVKFTTTGSITISLFRDSNSKITLVISDTGIGISEDFISKLYVPFSQEDPGYSRSFDGSGLGLALVKGYSILDNIRIDLESEKQVGTTVTVKLMNS